MLITSIAARQMPPRILSTDQTITDCCGDAENTAADNGNSLHSKEVIAEHKIPFKNLILQNNTGLNPTFLAMESI